MKGFLVKLKNLSEIPEEATLETTDMIELYLTILHVETNSLTKFLHRKVHPVDIIKMTDFLLKTIF